MSIKYNNWEVYQKAVIAEIKSRISPALFKCTVKDDDDLLSMVQEFRNEYGEYDLRFPDHIPNSIENAYQDDMGVKEYVDEVIEGIIILLEGSASVM